MLPLLPLPASHPLVLMFQVKTLNSLNSPTDNELALCDRLLSEDFFPRSMWIMALRGNVLYYLHGTPSPFEAMFLVDRPVIASADFTSAEAQFRKILAIDPYRVDDIDILSNILYVTENGTALSKLAHDYLAIDKDRPEICCIIGAVCNVRCLSAAQSVARCFMVQGITTHYGLSTRKRSSTLNALPSSIGPI